MKQIKINMQRSESMQVGNIATFTRTMAKKIELFWLEKCKKLCDENLWLQSAVKEFLDNYETQTRLQKEANDESYFDSAHFKVCRKIYNASPVEWIDVFEIIFI